MDDKKRFKLHVALLEASGVKSADAPMRAWLDGPAGLDKLMQDGIAAHAKAAKEADK